MTCMPIRMGISRRPLIIRDPTFANELNRPASIRLLRRTIAAACAPKRPPRRRPDPKVKPLSLQAMFVQPPGARLPGEQHRADHDRIAASAPR